ncbi:MAG: hydroxylamine reductase [Parasporobacterium sp.]|nr:hydroxylamine reductase [Parasporobacterium sp.]
MLTKMYCNQCQETAGGKECVISGVCGKKPEVALMQDLLIYLTKGLSFVTNRLREEGKYVEKEVNRMVSSNLFTTMTNVNFDKEAIIERIKETLGIKSALLQRLDNKNNLPNAATWFGEEQLFEIKAVNIASTHLKSDEDKKSLKDLVLYGLKGLAAYLYHANVLEFENDKIDSFLQKALSKLLDNRMTINELMVLVLETGKYGVETMGLLDRANSKTYGNPEVTKVIMGEAGRPGILVSGHDLRDLGMLLEQSKEAGVDVYTHGEMLPAHFYPSFKAYPHLVGNYGGAWWKQREEFEAFNGPILMTSNCIVPPSSSYQSRLWTTGACGYPGCKHIDEDSDGRKNFVGIIRQAKSCKAPEDVEKGEIIGGFAYNQAFTVMDRIADAIKTGKIRKIVVMAGCDGRQKTRKYYSEFAKSLPSDVVIITAGCAKYRFNKHIFGNIDGIPRLLDAGQCNDAYSIALVALKLKGITGKDDINELPIEYNLSWYEQKAVIVLLALLYLGVKNIHLGPTLPAFLSINVANILKEKFGLVGIKTVEEDINALI